MAKKKGKPVNGTKAPPVKPFRKGRALSIYLDRKISEAMDKFRAAQELRPGYTAIVNAALRDYLAQRGFPVPGSS